MKVILSMAVSANGIIATKTGSEDFLYSGNWVRFIELARKVGCIIWGRKTYQQVISWEGDYLKDIQDIKKVIISRSSIQLKEGFILASFPEEALEILRKEGFKEVIVTGGSKTNMEFAKRGLIDEVILDVNSIIIGEGISVFAQGSFDMKLELIESVRVNENILELRYMVVK
ncbi:MAG: dihydrofolate reductase family protein [bacterium]|nr:dihydrofolate reductase family protein [bacterium]